MERFEGGKSKIKRSRGREKKRNAEQKVARSREENKSPINHSKKWEGKVTTNDILPAKQCKDKITKQDKLDKPGEGGCGLGLRLTRQESVLDILHSSLGHPWDTRPSHLWDGGAIFYRKLITESLTTQIQHSHFTFVPLNKRYQSKWFTFYHISETLYSFSF